MRNHSILDLECVSITSMERMIRQQAPFSDSEKASFARVIYKANKIKFRIWFGALDILFMDDTPTTPMTDRTTLIRRRKSFLFAFPNEWHISLS